MSNLAIDNQRKQEKEHSTLEKEHSTLETLEHSTLEKLIRIFIYLSRLVTET